MRHVCAPPVCSIPHRFLHSRQRSSKHAALLLMPAHLVPLVPFCCCATAATSRCRRRCRRRCAAAAAAAAFVSFYPPSTHMQVERALENVAAAEEATAAAAAAGAEPGAEAVVESREQQGLLAFRLAVVRAGVGACCCAALPDAPHTFRLLAPRASCNTTGLPAAVPAPPSHVRAPCSISHPALDQSICQLNG